MVTIEEIGRRIREERLRQGLSVARLSAKSNVADSVVTRLESGAGVHLGSFMAVMDSLGLSYSAVFTETTDRRLIAGVLRQLAAGLECEVRR